MSPTTLQVSVAVLINVAEDQKVKERINKLKSIKGGYEFVTDRIYKSSQAYNTKNKIHLLLYKLSKDTYVCVNKHVKDYGRELSDAKGLRVGQLFL